MSPFLFPHLAVYVVCPARYHRPRQSRLKPDPSLRYATSALPLDPKHLIARIGTANAPSIALFHSLGFSTAKIVEVFSEAELRFTADPGQVPWARVNLEERLSKYDA